MSALPKPILRGHIKRKGIKTLIGAFCFAAVNGTLFNYFVVVPRKESYAKFLETYDGEAHYNNLKKWGYISIDRFIKEVRDA